MRKDNTQNYETPLSNLTHFSDFEDDNYGERDELDRVKRSYVHNDDHLHDLPNLTKYKFNKVAITREKIGCKFGEFSLTRKYYKKTVIGKKGAKSVKKA